MHFVETFKNIVFMFFCEKLCLATWGLTWQRLGGRQFGVTAGRVHAADFNEAGHEHDEGDAHQ